MNMKIRDKILSMFRLRQMNTSVTTYRIYAITKIWCICHFKIQILDGLELNSGFDLYVTHHNRDYVDKRTGTY